jgi:hypothetical protein
MKMTTDQWTAVQDVLDRRDNSFASRLLVEWIERRTFGKVWSEPVAVGLQRDDERRVYEALQRIAEAGTLDSRWARDLLDAAPLWRKKEIAKRSEAGAA